jgi:hypothetical protein
VTEPHPDHDSIRSSPWTRALSKRQVVLAFGAVGWLAAFLMMTIGDYQIAHRLPTAMDLLGYAALAAVFAPIFALIGAWKSASIRRWLSRNPPSEW